MDAERLARFVEWDFCARPLPPNRLSGDAHALFWAKDALLVAVVDGLGHGAEAGAVAERALSIVATRPEDRLEAILTRCHQQLVGSRGVALSLARIRPLAARLEWCAVGDVAGGVFRGGEGRTRESMVTLPGVVGYQMPQLRVSEVAFEPGAALVVATDGVAPGFAAAVDPDASASRLARDIVNGWADGHDDALVVVVRRLR